MDDIQNKTFHINKITNPKGLKKDEYDCIIIGAGIGGLVCGCYLAKAGLKVLIVEQHNKVGGYCQSFERDGFRFDTGIHSLESCSPEGKIGKLINDLNLYEYLKIIRIDPSDIIITPDCKIKIKNNFNETIQEFQKAFPNQAKQIEIFFNYIKNENFFSLYISLRNKVFKDVLDKYFNDYRVKETICVLLRNIGLPSTKVAAINAVLFLKEYLLDNGYYPLGGMQEFPNALSKRFKDFNGQLILSTTVRRIIIKNKEAKGIILEDDEIISSKYVISSCDVTQTFLKMIDKDNSDKIFINRLKKMIPTVSTFIVFLGIKKSLKDILEKCCALWYFSDYNIDGDLLAIVVGRQNFSYNGLEISCPTLFDSSLASKGKETIFIITTAPFKDKKFWDRNKNNVSKKIIERLENIISRLSAYIEVKKVATPYTFFKYTFNRGGSIHGWAPLLNQIDTKLVSEKTNIKNLFLASQWTTQPGQGGIPMVVQSASKVAKLIIEGYRYE